MKLNKDGTATLVVSGTEIVLPVLTWSVLKERKSAFETLLENANQITSLAAEAASPEALAVYTKALARTDEAEVEYAALSPEDQETVLGLARAVKEQAEISQELAVSWWVETINAVTDTPVEADNLPSYLANTNKIQSYLTHVQTVPFDSGP